MAIFDNGYQRQVYFHEVNLPLIMNKASKSLLVVSLILLFGSCFGIDFAQAQNNELILEVTKKCDIQYTGDSCVAELKIANNTGKILDGEAGLHIDYKGICNNNELSNFDGEGIEAQFSIIDNDWLDFSGWENGTTAVSSFEIANGETQPKIEIETAPNLCPGEYTFSLELKGTTKEEEYTASSIVIGGGGGGGWGVRIMPSVNEPETAGTEKINEEGGEVKGAYTEKEQNGKEAWIPASAGMTKGDAETTEKSNSIETEREGDKTSALGLEATIGEVFNKFKNLYWLLIILLIIIILFLIAYILLKRKK